MASAAEDVGCAAVDVGCAAEDDSIGRYGDDSRYSSWQQDYIRYRWDRACIPDPSILVKLGKMG